MAKSQDYGCENTLTTMWYEHHSLTSRVPSLARLTMTRLPTSSGRLADKIIVRTRHFPHAQITIADYVLALFTIVTIATTIATPTEPATSSRTRNVVEAG